MSAPLLYPAPRHLVQSGGTCAVPTSRTISDAPASVIDTIPTLKLVASNAGWIRCVTDPASVKEPGDEAYRLDVRTDGVRIAARSEKGVRWALITLAQLIRQFPAQLPCLVIDDAPLFAERGFMLDISRDRIPTMSSLRELVDCMSLCKLNHLQLYTEHAFAYKGHEAVWRAADPITPEEMREIDAYASARGIALTANQNSFGHFERWLRHPGYAALGETDTPWIKREWSNHYFEPATLCPLDPRSIALVEGLFEQLFPLCSGRYANIGGDEPFDLGRGRSKDECARIGAGRVFSEYLTKVVRAAQRLGKQPQFWCDPHPNEDDGMPRDVVALVWDYEFDCDFATRLAAHATVGREVWVAPGASNWLTITSRTWNRRGNLDRACTEGRAHGARGMLNTEWGDCGHRQQWPLTLAGMADGAQASWFGADAYVNEALGLQVFGSTHLGAWIAALGNADEPISRGTEPAGAGFRRRNSSALFGELGAPLSKFDNEPELLAWQGCASRLAELGSSIPPVGGVVEEECRHVHEIAQFAADRGVARRTDTREAVRQGFGDRMCRIIAEHRRLWLKRSRYGGLEDSCNHYRRIVQPV